MSACVLRLYTDHLAAREVAAFVPTPRVIYVREGAATVRAVGQAATFGVNGAWQGEAACGVTGGSAGATVLRWELARADAPAGAALTLEANIAAGAADGHLMRCDRVDFPLGGIAYTHTHQGPGIRCLLTGGIRVEANGKTHAVGPGEAWFEAGPDPVLALASNETLTSFVRCMILPRALQGKSSIRYVRPEDADKPKTQQYQVFCDEPISL